MTPSEFKLRWRLYIQEQSREKFWREFDTLIDSLDDLKYNFADREVQAILWGLNASPRIPTHGSCCTCQKCGHGHDDCICEYQIDRLIIARSVWKQWLKLCKGKRYMWEFGDYLEEEISG